MGFHGISLGIEWDFIGISCEYHGNIRSRGYKQLQYGVMGI